MTECNSLPSSISESSPFDLDDCPLENGDDITALLTDIALRWGNVYVRAPSKSLSLESAFTQWTVDDFYFVENQDPGHTLLIQHTAVETGYTASAAAICDINYGFLHFSMSDGSTAELADVRANVHFSQGYALVTAGS